MHAFWFAFVLWSVLFLLMSFLRNSATLDSHFLFFFKKFQTLAGLWEFLIMVPGCNENNKHHHNHDRKEEIEAE